MTRLVSVPPRLQQPLCVDTDIDYSLDMSKFPGLDDPQHILQPALLIATPDNVRKFHGQIWNDAIAQGDCQPELYHRLCSGYQTQMHTKSNMLHRRDRPRVQHLHQHRVQAPVQQVMNSSNVQLGDISDRDMLEGLLNVIDSCSSAVLDRLLDSIPINNYENTNKLPHNSNSSQMLSSTRFPQYNGCPTLKSCTGDKDYLNNKGKVTMNAWNQQRHHQNKAHYSNGYSNHTSDAILKKPVVNSKKTMVIDLTQDSDDLIPDYLYNLSALANPYVKPGLCMNRKRPAESYDVPSHKRQCVRQDTGDATRYLHGQHSNINHSQHYISQNYPFQETMQQLALVM